VTGLLTPPLDDDDHVDGPAGAPLELVMYGDFQCPYCTAAQPILRRVRDRLGERLRFAFRHFPLSELHPDAQRAAEASEAAAAQGAFWPMHDALYGARGQLGADDVVAIAGRLGLDADRVRDELADGTHAARVARDVESGLAGGVGGTPTFFANGVRHTGAFDAQSLIAALEAGQAAEGAASSAASERSSSSSSSLKTPR
jgi:Na+:H+ antiporter, NhaA family